MEFPHMGDASFPDLSNIDVFRYQNEVDYDRYGASGTIKVCNVPWDESHNNVAFDGVEARDAYLDGLTGPVGELPTAFLAQPKATVQVPMPGSACLRYNYCVIDVPPVPSEDAPLMHYEGARNVTRFCYFVTGADFRAPNTTMLYLSLDSWQMWSYDLDVQYVGLARGHYGVAKTDVDTYLANPRGNSEHLLAPDFDHGSYQVTRNAFAKTFDSQVWMAFACNSAPHIDGWGSVAEGTALVPYVSTYDACGAPSYFTFAIDPADWAKFGQTADTDVPHFKQTVVGVYFVDRSLVTTHDEFAFCGVTCHLLTQVGSLSGTIRDLTKDDFGLPEQVSGFAKLYTYPYSYLEVADHTGNARQIRVESTGGSIGWQTALSFAAPYVTQSCVVTGVGEGTTTQAWANLVGHSFEATGEWAHLLYTWHVPTYAVTLASSVRETYERLYPHNQAVVEYTRNYDDTMAVANTEHANERNQTECMSANNAATVANNSANNSRKISAETQINAAQLNKLTADKNADNFMVYTGNEATQAANAASQSNNEASGAANTIAGTASGIGSVITGALTGSALGPVGMAGGALVGAATALAGLGQVTTSTMNASASLQVAYTNNDQLAGATTTNNIVKTQNAQEYLQIAQAQNNDCATDVTDNNNSLLNTTTANSVNMLDTNADNNLSTATANAGRTRSAARSAIANDTASIRVQNGSTCGEFAHGDVAPLRPRGIWLNVVTEPDGALLAAGSQFARYGYAENSYVKFEGWQMMGHFTYWQCFDVVFSGTSDMSVSTENEIRSLLANGITIWTDPDEIGRVSIYDN